MSNTDIEALKEVYKKEWKEAGGDQEIFLKLVRLKERERKLREELRTRSERAKKREARALIILAKILMKELDKEQLRMIIEKHREEFKQKERKKERKEVVDYLNYLKVEE